VPVQVSSKIGVIESLIEKVDKIILGGGMIFTFFKARGMGVGSSLVEDDNLDLAKRLEKLAKDKGENRMCFLTAWESTL
jgi:phosphoglycerate kinase